MFKIGMFSKMNHITVKTLRYYDEIGILKPAYTDQITGFRYYTTNELNTLHQILGLKQLGLSLSEIKTILLDKEDETVLFTQKKEELMREIEVQQQQLKMIQAHLENKKGGNKMQYEVVLKSLPSVTVASMRKTIQSYDDLFHLCPSIMGKEMNRVGCVCSEPSYCFNIYHDDEYKEENIDVEICEAVTEKLTDTDILTFKEIKGVPQAACLLHKGPYTSLAKSYSKLYDWINRNGFVASGHPRESFLDGIWNKEDESDWLTEIQIPIQKA